MASDRDALAQLLHDEGAWCGDCDYEEGPCGECDRILGGYADRILAAGWRPPAREITDPAQLDALPLGSNGRTPKRAGATWELDSDGWWGTNLRGPYTSAQVLTLGPFTLLWTPEDGPR